jgi:CBS domain-containing protein
MTKAKEIMTTEVVSIKGSSTVSEAVKLMKDKKLRTLIVEPRSEDDPYGVVTETDIVYKVAAYGHDPKEMRVYEIMTKPCIVVNPDLEVEYIARLFAQARIRCAPVIQDGLLGVISVSDILRKSDFVEQPKQLLMEDRIEAAREEALAICAEQGANSPACASAWDALEEIRAEAAHQRSKKKSGR